MHKKMLILAGALVLLSSCGAKKDAPAPAETSATAAATTAATEAETTTAEEAAETTTVKEAEEQPSDAPEETTTTAVPAGTDENVFQGNGLVSFSMPDITVSMPDISLPDMTPPDIEAFMAGDGAVTTTAAATEQSETVTTTVTEAEQSGTEVIETEVEESGFVYKGQVMEVGDDEHGYIMVPADCHRFYDDTATNLIQYSDDYPANIITIKHLPGVSSYMAAQGIMKGIDDKGIVEGLTGATVKLGDYDAYQIYGLYPDGVFEVIWVAQDKNDPENCYYICFELDSDHMDDLALASTYKMPADHK